MTTADLIETFITEAVRSLKNIHRHQKEGRMLDRHEPVVLDGYTYTTWREFAVHATAEHIQQVLPDADFTKVVLRVIVVVIGLSSCNTTCSAGKA